ncbi:LOW QUALITY PROTEIN: ionotropic receptor 93a [Nilaparvata lugens]|uniref:LOW QUALITY PROTEIN: ionotropic receptor 93a n=1 Tax=Nilaparvata lugens TaxID=108931 RepID=UPI00193DDE30|nr:LOW QUALITY PROTEIN: ionotropic receptor 93a [Nilaparvata lugens]
MDVRIIFSLISISSVVFSARDSTYNSYGAAVDVGSKLSMVVAIEKDFLGEDTDEVLSVIKKYASIINKEYLPVGHLRTRYQTLKEAAFTDGVSIVLSIGACRDTWELFEKRQENSDILFISITEVECPRLPTGEAITLPLSTAGKELPQLLLDLRSLNAVQWKSVALIYDQISLTDDDIQSVTEALTIELPGKSYPSSALLSIHKLEPGDNEWKRRKNIQRTLRNLPGIDKNRNFLAIVEHSIISVILDLAKSEKLLDPTTQWLFVLSDVGDSENVTEFAYLLDEGQNIAFVYNNTSEKLACGDSRISCHVEEIMLSIGLALQKSVLAELELSEQVSEEEWDAIKPSKSDRRATLLSSIKSRLQNEGRCDNCTVWKLETGEVWGQEYLEARVTKLLSVGSWTPRGGPLLSDHLFPHVVQGFRARNLPISTFHVRYTVHVPTNLTLTGFSNSTKNIGLPIETLEGDKDESALNPAVWNKVISAVQQKKMFLGACAFTVTDARKLAVNFTTAISVEPYVFFLSRPKELSRALLFMSPFTISTWCCITAAVILMTPVLCAISRASPFYRVYGANRAGGFHSPMNCFWYIYGALLQQGGGALPAADSSRLVIGTWWLVVLVVVTTYSGTLVAFLTFPKMDALVADVTQLLASGHHLTWGIPAGSTLQASLKSSDEDKLKALYKGARLHPSISKELIEDIRSGHHVYIQRKTSLLFLLHRLFLNTSTCDFSLGSEEFMYEHLAMAITKGSPYLKIINKQIDWMHRVGLIGKWLKQYLPEKDQCSVSVSASEVNNHKVNLDDMQGSFFVLFLGFAASVLLIGIEFLIKKYVIAKERRIIQPFVT